MHHEAARLDTRRACLLLLVPTAADQRKLEELIAKAVEQQNS